MKLETTKTLNIFTLANKIKWWFEEGSWETKIFEYEGSQHIKARKSSWWRAAIGADRALQVSISNIDGTKGTRIEVKQGDWTTNLVSNAAWIIFTGGTNLLISGWSVVLQKKLEKHILQLLNEMQPEYNHGIEINETEISQENIGLEERQWDNSCCDSELQQEINISRTWSQSYEINFEKITSSGQEKTYNIETSGNFIKASESLKNTINEKLLHRYSINGTVQQTHSEKLSFRVHPKSKLVLILHWKRNWQNGVINIHDATGHAIRIPYRVITGLTIDPTTKELTV